MSAAQPLPTKRRSSSGMYSGATVVDFAGDVAELRSETESRRTIADTPYGSDERARVVEWQRCNTRAEVTPDTVLPQVLLDVREIERRHGGVLLFEVRADGANRLGT